MRHEGSHVAAFDASRVTQLQQVCDPPILERMNRQSPHGVKQMRARDIQGARSRSGMTRLLVLGGGFGGVEAARRLERLLRGRDDVEVTLVSRDNFFLFTPMLHEVAASDIDLTHIVSPLRALGA
jgi:NADPH-dependent 2,4-dienoyl-CoA reductase/sulfur reductase-like enzyme